MTITIEAPPQHRRRPFARRLQALAGLLIAFFIAAAFTATPANAAVVAQYRVTITGTASGNAFSLIGFVTVATTVTRVTNNGVNPYEVCLTVGNPASIPQVGAIRYGTNSACFPQSRPSNIDMVFASAGGTNYVAQPDSRLQATYINVWTASNNYAFAYPYSPIAGSASYTITNGGISGRVLLTGQAPGSGNSTYNATLSGVRIA